MPHPHFLSLTAFRTAALALAVATTELLPARAGVVVLEQTLSAKYGWNALYVEVSPTLTRIYTSTKLYDNNVVLAPCNEISDWSGVLYVSPMDGLDYATNATVRTLTIRNDSTKERNTSIDIVPMDGSRDLVGSLYFRDSDVAITNSVWQKVETTHVATKVLATGETWRVEFGLDRSIFDGDVRGTPFGAALRITDDGGTSKWRVDVPLQGEASGTSADRNAWPGGLWVAEIEFDEIYFAGDPDAGYTGTGGTLKARLPVHFGSDGKVRLLQRVVAAGETSADGEFDYTLYAGSATVPSTYRQAMRISSAVLPTETPVVEASEDEFESGRLVFDFAVAADGATSLLRHPLHPQHDGLRWDFSTPAPDGDDWENYRDTVKPETFSVVNRIIMQIELSGGETTWNPEDTKSGTCYWNLSGLRHEGAIVLRGPMVFKRVAPQSEIVLE